MPIAEFIACFTHEKLAWRQRGRKYFIIPSEMLRHEKTIFPALSTIGLFLGETKNNAFFPSLALLTILAKQSQKKAFVTDKAAWLFLCGKDIQNESIIKKNSKEGIILVQNKNDENLGYGKITKTGIKNILDRGDYLRRERNSSSTR